MHTYVWEQLDGDQYKPRLVMQSRFRAIKIFNEFCDFFAWIFREKLLLVRGLRSVYYGLFLFNVIKNTKKKKKEHKNPYVRYKNVQILCCVKSHNMMGNFEKH